MNEQNFNIGDRVRVLKNVTGVIIDTDDLDIHLKYRIERDDNHFREWISKDSLKLISSNTKTTAKVKPLPKLKQTINIEINNLYIVVRIQNEGFLRVIHKDSLPKGKVEVVDGITIDFDRLSKIPNKPEITEKQKTILETLYLLGYRYIACDERNNLYAYEDYPCKYVTAWGDDYEQATLNFATTILDNLCSWEDEKPISIGWLLGKKDENE